MDPRSVWRPLSPVENWPLALCDGSSMKYDDLLEVDLIRKDYIGSTMYAKYRDGFRWYYLENQKPEEVCFFKNFDSCTDVRAQSEGLFLPDMSGRLIMLSIVCPHVSFDQDNAPQNASPRESIEVRALVFTYAEN